MTGNDGFGRLVRAEWTKLRSVNRWALTLALAAGLTVGFGLFIAAVSVTDFNNVDRRPFVVSFDGRPVADEFTFVHRPLAGDGSVTARLTSQAGSHEWATAGVMIKGSATPGSPYAALALTAGHGLRLQANFDTDRDVGAGTAPRWLRLTRTGTTVAGSVSTDGSTWRPVGDVTVAGLPADALAGVFVSSPERVVVTRQAGSTSSGGRPTAGIATFDNVGLDPAAATPPPWTADRVPGTGIASKGGDPLSGQQIFVDSGGVFRVAGSGRIGTDWAPDDPMELSLFGILVGVLALIPVGVLFVTSEYKRGMIRTTFAVTRGRGRVLAAKAVVLGLTTFAVGLASTLTAFLLTQPILRSHGYAPPAFRYLSLSDPAVLRAVVGSAGFLALMAVFSLAVGAILRHSAGAITTAIVLLIMPIVASASVPVAAAKWLMYLTPTGGLAIARAQPPTELLAAAWSGIDPWAGLGTVAAYAAVSLTGAYLLLRRRDA